MKNWTFLQGMQKSVDIFSAGENIGKKMWLISLHFIKSIFNTSWCFVMPVATTTEFTIITLKNPVIWSCELVLGFYNILKLSLMFWL